MYTKYIYAHTLTSNGKTDQHGKTNQHTFFISCPLPSTSIQSLVVVDLVVEEEVCVFVSRRGSLDWALVSAKTAMICTSYAAHYCLNAHISTVGLMPMINDTEVYLTRKTKKHVVLYTCIILYFWVCVVAYHSVQVLLPWP